MHSKKFSAKARASFQASADPARVAATLAAEEKMKALFQAGALRGIVQYGSLPPRAGPVPQGRPRDPVTGGW
jgi:hypothetical protein